MKVENLNEKAERLVELYKERKKVRRCREQYYERIFGSLNFDFYGDQFMNLIEGSGYPQDEEIERLRYEIGMCMQELGFSDILINSLNIKHYADMFCVEYVPYKNNKYSD